MATFTRLNALTITVTFTPAVSGGPQPSTAYVSLSYKNLDCAVTSALIDLAYNATPNNWTGTWDTANAGPGTVQWAAYGAGAMHAAAEGTFNLTANAANITQNNA